MIQSSSSNSSVYNSKELVFSFIYSIILNNSDADSEHFFSITSTALKGSLPINTGTPFLMIPAFSAVISSLEVPRILVCSRLIEVIIDARGFIRSEEHTSELQSRQYLV